MKLELFLFTFLITSCFGVKLNPLENNDKLQDISNLYVAEWQWESWPVKQNLSEQEGRLPGQRKNVALWRDTSKSVWYLFGGQPINGDSKKMYSDVWKFSIKTRMWKRLFPTQEVKSINKKGGVATLRSKLFDRRNSSDFEPISHRVVLCGVSGKQNSTKIKKSDEWSRFRRKKLEEKNDEELTHLAVFAAKPSKFNTVWQIDIKEKLWTAYFCCCDTISNSLQSLGRKKQMSDENSKNLNEKDMGKKSNTTKTPSPIFDSEINGAEDEEVKEEQYVNLHNSKNKKKKINQIKKSNEKFHLKKINIEKRKYNRKERNATETTSEEGAHVSKNKIVENFNSTKGYSNSKKEEYILKTKNISESSEDKLKTEKPEKSAGLKLASDSCPESVENHTFVTWCDGRNEALISADLSSPEIVVWVYNLNTSHWSQLQVNVSEGVKWPSCSNINSIRYAGNEDEVFIICSNTAKQNKASSQSSINSTKVPSKNNFNKKLVYKINYKEQILRSLGEILMNPYFSSIEGENIWQNDTRSNLQVLKNSENETILILAYMEMVDLWILNKDNEGKESFDLIEKVWRGSALKWFDKYNAALYSFQFVSESGSSETILLPNPRHIEANEYWPRERGKFIIRIFRNENLKNQSFENRTREQNLTYELLQSDFKPSGAENQLNHMYNLKVLVFFGISLAIFSLFGFVVFLKRCVNCPSRIRIRNECHKSPLIIRYSVIPDDMLYPVA